jgi:hypothetical protein
MLFADCGACGAVHGARNAGSEGVMCGVEDLRRWVSIRGWGWCGYCGSCAGCDDGLRDHLKKREFFDL